MRVTCDIQGNWDLTNKWLAKMSKFDSKKVLESAGSDGVSALGKATPIGETGQTALSWKHKVSGDELSFHNTAHPEESVNIAKIKDLGHGTGTGGYVVGQHYISPAMQPVWEKLSKTIDKELRS